MLRLENIRLVLGSFHLTADLVLPAQSRTAIMGPSGAGKSTLLAAIAGFQPLEQGRIVMDDRDISRDPPGQRPISMVFQDGNLFAHMTAAQNVGLGLRPDLRLDADQWRTVDAALTRVGLSGLGSRKPAALSGGQQSRVTLARVLVQRRALIALDEPFAALGPAQRRDMLQLVADLSQEIGATLLMVTHDPADAVICDLTLVVADGVVAAPAPTASLLADPPAALAAYLGKPA